MVLTRYYRRFKVAQACPGRVRPAAKSDTNRRAEEDLLGHLHSLGPARGSSASVLVGCGRNAADWLVQLVAGLPVGHVGIVRTIGPAALSSEPTRPRAPFCWRRNPRGLRRPA